MIEANERVRPVVRCEMIGEGVDVRYVLGYLVVRDEAVVIVISSS